jgi:mRNA-degrading endonuclease toxin of MazEF toxin-antitoxin module
MKVIALAGATLVLSLFTVAAEPLRAEVVVQAATPEPQATPAHTPPPPIKRASAEIVVQAAAAASPQSAATVSPTPTAAKELPSEQPVAATDHATATTQAVNPDSVVPKDKVIALVKRIEEQHAQIEENQMKIDQQLADITLMVQQAYDFSRKASK